jgi:hypothetical protein
MTTDESESKEGALLTERPSKDELWSKVDWWVERNQE